MSSHPNMRITAVLSFAALGLAIAGIGASGPVAAQKPPAEVPNGAIGDIKPSMLLEPQLLALPEGKGWVLADGRNVAGSKYATITGMNTIPDLRGVFLRGKNYGRSPSTGNADGDLSLGTHQSNQNAAHSHGYTRMIYNNAIDGVDSCCTGSYEHRLGPDVTAASGGNEARPNAVTVNYFIKIN